MANSRVADIGTLQLAVADGRLLVLYPFWKDPFAFTQFKDENSKMADSRVGDIGTLQLAVADGSHIQCHRLGLNELLLAPS